MLDPIASAVDSALLASAWAEAVAYSRPGNAILDPVAAFTISVVIDTSGEYSDPSRPIYADVFLQVATIPLGPQKGDELVIADGAIRGGTYVAQEICWDRRAGSAHLKVRWLSE
jgi:hypothetical protein